MNALAETLSAPESHRQKTLNRLIDLSVTHKTNPFADIEWPESLPEDVLWMPKHLMTVHGTQAAEGLSEQDWLRLSKWESIWFYSFNVHGERHLLRDVLDCMHTPGYEDISEYMHHFVCEENNHSWFFSHFCTRYGGKVYTDKRIQFQSEAVSQPVQAFLIFARILILEEMLDYYNVAIDKDETIPGLIRQLNRLHHLSGLSQPLYRLVRGKPLLPADVPRCGHSRGLRLSQRGDGRPGPPSPSRRPDRARDVLFGEDRSPVR
jgi:hypothetical protein